MARVRARYCAVPSRRRGEAAFTLIEILIALALLAAGVTTLYGLQAANTRTTLQMANENQAVLLARQFFATMEVQPEGAPPISEQIVEGSFEELYRAIKMKPPLLSEDARVRFRVMMVVDKWALGDLLPKPMRRMQLRVFWGPTSRDTLTLTYFLPPIGS